MTNQAGLGKLNEFTAEVARDCLLTRARRISRVITSIYDDALRPHGLNSPQLSLLVLISRLDGASRAELGRANHQDRSTLSRNLSLLLEAGWVEEGAGPGRTRPIGITAAGRQLMLGAAASWRTAQEEARRLLGADGCASILGIGDSLEAETV